MSKGIDWAIKRHHIIFSSQQNTISFIFGGKSESYVRLLLFIQ